MKHDMELNNGLKVYLRWPVIMGILLIVMNIVSYTFQVSCGIVVSIFVALYFLMAFLLYRHYKKYIVRDLILFGSGYAQIQRQLLQEMLVPYAVVDEADRILWMNGEFQRIVEQDGRKHRHLSSVFNDITVDKLRFKGESAIFHSVFLERNYQVSVNRVTLNDIMDSLIVGERKNNRVDMFAVYLFDETEELRYQREVEDERLVAGLIYLDNYEEALDSIEDVRRSLLLALIDRKINKYISSYDGILKKIEKDKYFIVLKQCHLAEMQKNHFSLLEDVKTVNIGNQMAMTLSIGLGAQGNSYIRNYEYARTAIDMALGRGGDQVVLKAGENITYYGGKSHTLEKNTRVKARVKAHALRELIESREKVIIMGHWISDVDCIGAAIGIYRAAKTSGKKANIVVNNVSSSVKPLMERFYSNPDYEEDLFINNETALERMDANTLLVVVDTNRPSYTECPDLLKKAQNIVVLDHHRQTREVIENAVLSYVEPYASSTCEMVAEILQYYSEDLKIKSIDADAIYAGIVIDTNNFMNKTGVRTFEAAAFLRRNGADVTRVRKLFRDNMADYKAKAEAIRNAEVFEKYYAVSICPSDASDNPTVIGAQAANELLGIRGIKASFVLTEFNGQIYISARSIDEVNVQIIMERLGGGGHMSVAGAQLKDMTVEEAVNRLKDTITEMESKKDI
ncbi:MAG TPA: DHH family phosphoesterase [Candidatus Fimimorpha excrementavium]|nr:DHH family phosphoesterase [Candidatus Fimimorpha excrementavium]